MRNVYQYLEDKKKKDTKHDWYFEFCGCECGPFAGRDCARKFLKRFKEEYIALLKKYNGANHLNGIFTD